MMNYLKSVLSFLWHETLSPTEKSALWLIIFVDLIILDVNPLVGFMATILLLSLQSRGVMAIFLLAGSGLVAVQTVLWGVTFGIVSGFVLLAPTVLSEHISITLYLKPSINDMADFHIEGISSTNLPARIDVNRDGSASLWWPNSETVDMSARRFARAKGLLSNLYLADCVEEII